MSPDTNPFFELPATPPVQPEVSVSDTSPQTPDVERVDEKLMEFVHNDPIYLDMLRVVEREKIRLKLSLRYTFLMFGIFLVFAWIVSNRVIMFGFAEFVWLSRIRDGLFGVMAGLFALTVWHGSPVWFQNALITIILRVMAGVFFIGVLLALYFPIF